MWTCDHVRPNNRPGARAERTVPFRAARARGCGVLGDARRTPHAPPPLTAFASAFPLTFRSSLVVTLYDAVTVFAVLSRVIGTTSNK